MLLLPIKETFSLFMFLKSEVELTNNSFKAENNINRSPVCNMILHLLIKSNLLKMLHIRIWQI